MHTLFLDALETVAITKIAAVWKRRNMNKRGKERKRRREEEKI